MGTSVFTYFHVARPLFYRVFITCSRCAHKERSVLVSNAQVVLDTSDRGVEFFDLQVILMQQVGVLGKRVLIC